MGLNIDKIREDFPILGRKIHGKRLIYFDNAATSLKPIQVINSIISYYKEHCAKVHRGIHTLSQEASDMYERAREEVAKMINAKTNEIIFTLNATDSINLVAQSWALDNLKEGDIIVTTVMEHHSNMLPWRIVANRVKVEVKYIDITDEGILKCEELEKLVDENVKLIAITHVSNVLGTINDIMRVIKVAHNVGSLVLVDGAQSVPHMPLDVKELDIDFLAFSGHKMLGPTGIGVLYAKEEILEEMKPSRVGGGTIKEVTLSDVKYEEVPLKFEAGTPNIAGAIGLAEAVRYLRRIGMENVFKHELDLVSYTFKLIDEELKDSIEVYGPKNPNKRCGIVTFNIKDLNPDVVAALLDARGIAVRSGKHCAHPLYQRLRINGAVRASYYIYNTRDEVEYFIEVLKEIVKSKF